MIFLTYIQHTVTLTFQKKILSINFVNTKFTLKTVEISYNEFI